jgi:hypothetical protein
MAQLGKRLKDFFKSYPKKISFWGLAKYWIIFEVVGIAIMQVLYFAFPSLMSSVTVSAADFCTPFNILYVILFAVFEVIVFMILPFMWKQKRGLAVGLIIWAILHLLSADVPVFIYISIMSVFYYKAISVKKYKDVLILIFLLNTISMLSCI